MPKSLKNPLAYEDITRRAGTLLLLRLLMAYSIFKLIIRKSVSKWKIWAKTKKGRSTLWLQIAIRRSREAHTGSLTKKA